MKTVNRAKHIENRIKTLKAENQVALIPYITAFDPSRRATLEFLKHIADTNPAVIELGFPFSDPIADGPTIQKAMVRALANNPSFEDYLELVATFKEEFPDTPIVCMTYYNIIYRFGLERAVKFSIDAFLDGFIIPDLPPEEASDWLKVTRNSGLATIFLGAPTSSLDRIKTLSRLSRGFFYYVSLTGITGMRDTLPEDLVSRLKEISQAVNIPLAVGFGISKREHVSLLRPYVDAVVVGSALVNIIEREGEKAGSTLRDFIDKLLS